jgi:hypothetical protein
MPGTPFSFGPVALTTTLTTNILNPGTTTGGVNATSSPYGKTKIVLKCIRVVNKTSSAATFTLYTGATGANTAGTELALAKNVPANDFVDVFVPVILTTADFLVGGAGTATALTIQGYGEIMVDA